MQAWDAVPVPKLPPSAHRVRLYNPRTRDLVAVGPQTGEARLYACGITPYDATHLGHAFTYVTIDLLVRAWRDAGLGVRYAQNITDVDDPLLERATATARDWAELAAEQIELYRADMAALRVLPPSHFVGVVEAMDMIADTATALRDGGDAYAIPDPEYPDWYFRVDEAGLLERTGLPRDQALALFAERGGDPGRAGKHHQLDALLWRRARPDEPAWDSALGRGRPGWHIECAAIALATLGADFDVQAGGSDLAFPHHPMSALQAEMVSHQPCDHAALHTAMVAYDGQKMSKSLGNLVFVHRLLADGADPMAVRLMLLAQHYRSDWEYTPELLRVATRRLARWRAAVHRPAGPDAEPLLAAVRAALSSDLDAPTALGEIDLWAASKGATSTAAPAAVRDAVDALLGVRL
ncbi:MAG TPA: cysteine--1-D-myo-inosityl 2-amino-2-deoxy-alpha-D-glucopyranoside ligase [Propionibacteriaceae bacterium]|nr:cysteine--1-D-myo-inosityl 2-amino-2-deoxy-alpha-D-glucopyranoside ligase [Propionibacteriaceae bacterium]